MPPPTNSPCVPLRCTAKLLSASANAARRLLLSQWPNLVVLVAVIVGKVCKVMGTLASHLTQLFASPGKTMSISSSVSLYSEPLTWNAFSSSFPMLLPSQPSHHLLQKALPDFTSAQLGSPSEIAMLASYSTPTFVSSPVPPPA